MQLGFRLAVCAGAIALAGCSTVTVNPAGTQKIASQPTYEEVKPFYMWGLVGEHTVDVTVVCGDKQVQQMQTQQTFVDGLLGGLTLGIYAPRTAKVWCADKT